MYIIDELFLLTQHNLKILFYCIYNHELNYLFTFWFQPWLVPLINYSSWCLCNFQELKQLFDRLDTDSDGRISFEDFVGGVFQHNNGGASGQPRSRVGTPRSVTPRTHSAQKKFRASTQGAEERSTPSLISGSGASGLFTVLDDDHTGWGNFGYPTFNPCICRNFITIYSVIFALFYFHPFTLYYLLPCKILP